MRSRWIYLSILFCAILLTSCSREEARVAQGYIEGRYTYMATSVSGRLIALFVDRGNRVKQGQELFKLELQPESDLFKAAEENLAQALAQRDATTANLTYAKLTYERYKVLVVRNAIQQSALDNAKATFDATTAQLSQAEANIASLKATLAQSKWTLDQKLTFAPFDAIVFDTYFRIGEFVAANQSVLSLLVPSDIKAIFYIYEPALSSLQLNGKVLVRCDSCEKAYIGRITFISPTAEYTPPVIYSNETNAKLIFRIEASFDASDAYHLHPGQPVRVSY